MKLLFITDRFYPDIGGIEVNSEILAHHFYNTGVDVKLITWTSQTGNKTFPFPVIRNPNFSTLITLHQWADVVYENNPCLRLSWPAVLCNRVSVIALRTWINRKQDGAGWADKLKVIWLRRASKVIAVSEAVRKQCWPKAIVIGNPYRSELFRTKESIERTKDFVFLGRLVSDKGADAAVEAIYRLHTNHQASFTLTIIGDGPDKDKLASLAQEKGIAKQIRFTGSLQGEPLVDCLNQHTYLLVPSTWEEPFGNVALEGMACGCIPIVSDGGGLPDAVGEAGLVFKRGDINELVACMKIITADTELQERLRKNAIPHLQNHKPDVVAKRYLDVIVSALNQK